MLLGVFKESFHSQWAVAQTNQKELNAIPGVWLIGALVQSLGQSEQ